ncbi:transcriptional repressor TCF25-domain-containing protein [Biscogniauxia sp. FL1348]|nr:transcriptional repressor TCF25-domain-containing protein [Biscogniauxia sp. FL1348]
MSSRQLRKLNKQRELEALHAHNPAEDPEEESDDAPVQKSKPSIFSGFAALGDQDEQDDEDEDEDETAPAPAPPKPIETPKASSKKSKKKKKKAKKSGASTAKEEPVAQEDVDEIDQALRELALLKKPSAPGTWAGEDNDDSISKAYERICELLRINTYHLKVINEMRNLFGREAIAAAQNEEDEERARAQRQRRPLQQQVDLETYLRGQPGKSLPEVTLRRNPFLPGKDTWPRASSEGLAMTQLKNEQDMAKSGTVEFGFSHSPAYNELEKQFFGLVQMYDPMQLVHFLHRHPYHISCLIQVSKIAKQDQNSALSADLCERALFTFGRVSSSAFRQKLEEGKARLDFKRPENRQFWLAGYHYLKSLVIKGTYRTALEWSKLLFSMDLSDPYGIIHFIHPLAIRAHESKWFIDFCDSEALDGCDTAQDYIRQTLVLARLQQNDTAGAKALLLEGMERLPWLYGSLFKALNLDVPKAIWGLPPRDPDEEFYTELYVHQTKSLWDNAQAIKLLKEASSLAKKPGLATFPYPPVVGRNVGRFVYLDNTPSLMGLVPRGMLSESPNWEFDPLPPLFNENVFSYESQKLPWADRGGVGGPRLPSDVDAIRRILERARQEGAPRDVQRVFEEALADEEAENAGAGEGNGGGGGALGGFVQAFMDFLRPSSREGGYNNDEDTDYYYDSELENTMPGAWAEDSDDELPPLVPANDLQAEEDSTDDEMPPLRPA